MGYRSSEALCRGVSRWRGTALLLFLTACLIPRASATEPPRSASRLYDTIPELELFIDEMTEKHGFDRDELTAIFDQARLRPAIIKAMSKPAERKPWHEYREIFINDARIRNGVKFMHNHAEALMVARRAYGVPEEVTTAILGVETSYGRRTGRFGVLDALVTLAFNYPRRAKLFRRELEGYLLLTREEGFRAWSPKGSYAGAMGIAQFMPTSYRRYAVDFDGDGKRDLSKNVTDAIGSVANYFKEHGWRPGSPVTLRAQVSDTANPRILESGHRATRPIGEWKNLGVRPIDTVPDQWKAALITLKGAKGSEHWLAFHNFYVITRYNHSTNYAMAVHQLSREIESLRSHSAAALDEPPPGF